MMHPTIKNNKSAQLYFAAALALNCGLSYAATAKPDLQLCNQTEISTVIQPVADHRSDARAYWLSDERLRWPGKSNSGHFFLASSENAALKFSIGEKISNTARLIPLTPASEVSQDARFRFTGSGVEFLTGFSADQLKALLKTQLLLVKTDADQRIEDLTYIQHPGALDKLYAGAASAVLGPAIQKDTQLSVWAPTARKVWACIYPDHQKSAYRVQAMQADDATGIWSAHLNGKLNGQYYQYIAEVFVPGTGVVLNRVTDPYSVSLNADSKRSYIADLSDPALTPAGWQSQARPDTVRHLADMSIYEMHVRDFSVSDTSVRPTWRGKFLAFTEQKSHGIRYLKELAKAGMTDVHLLPVFDFATVPEKDCKTPQIRAGGNSPAARIAQAKSAASDCYNWGYDPFHFNSPEGSYSTNPDDAARRIIEFRQMVMALHKAGLRVGMDVVYNHTAFSGQHSQSVLDRIVPGYYHRLNNSGKVEDSTCQPCGNTATEHLMMGKLVSDSLSVWTNAYKIDSFRFDLMGHQPKALMTAIKERLESEAGRPVQLIGEGWNFGEVADSRRFVQASQLSLGGSGIGTFSDRARDALRGSGTGDTADSLTGSRGLLNMQLCKDCAQDSELLRRQQHAIDLTKAGLSGTLSHYRLHKADGGWQDLSSLNYNGQPAGYAANPGEAVNYIENHDNHTLFDINVLRLPANTGMQERVYRQILGLATTIFSQGVAYFHAGSELLRSKSLDANSYNSGDWFNRIDWTMRTNHFGTGLPPAADNQRFDTIYNRHLENSALIPSESHIRQTHAAFLDLLNIRKQSRLLHLQTAQDVQSQLSFPASSPAATDHISLLIQPREQTHQEPALLVFFNFSTEMITTRLTSLPSSNWSLHNMHLTTQHGDVRIRDKAKFNAETNEFSLPPLSVVVFTSQHQK
ncbi:alpha-1,6-glucosidase domain-containing protein [Undibacterium luofuense]|uniref:alpha-1,6-glucosidase domain-containing protein n=1 Tax=Undibacterium luofuense TaxID=2828733 RepID=UPI0030ED3B1B